MFSRKIYKIFKNTIFTEQLQWLLLTFNSYFQKGRERKPVRLSAINTTFSCKKVFAVAKVATSVKEMIPEFLSFYFRILSFFNFAMTKWFWSATCFSIAIISREFGIPVSSFSSSVSEIHFQKKFCEANLPFIPPEYHNIMSMKCKH